MVDENTPSAEAQAPDAASPDTQTSAEVPSFEEYMDSGSFPDPESKEITGDAPTETVVTDDSDDAASDDPEDAPETLSFDPEPLAGGDGSEEGDAPDGYTPLAEPEWLDSPTPEQVRNQFKGLQKLHREQAQSTAYRAAKADPAKAHLALRAEIEEVAERFGVPLPDLLTQYVAPELAIPDAEDPEGDEEEVETNATSEVSPEILAAALKKLGIDPEDLKRTQTEAKARAEQAELDSKRAVWIQKTGTPLAAHITTHPKGFDVTPEDVMQAREYAYQANDQAALKDPLLAVRRLFPDRFAAAEVARRARPAKAPTMASASGSGAEEIAGFEADDFAKYAERIGLR